MIKLQITEWDQTEEFLIYKNFIEIGSHSSNDLILMDKSLSKKLIQLSVQSATEALLQPHHFSELSLNGIALKSQSIMLIGDSIQIGQTEIKLLALGLDNPFIKSAHDIDKQIQDFKENKPHLKKILDYLDKVGSDV